MDAIACLEIEVERLTQRCKALQAFLSKSGSPREWDRPVPPLSLYESRVMRLVGERPVTGGEAVNVLSAWYPETSSKSLDVILNRIRRRLPEEIAPAVRLNGSRYALIDVRDREALKHFLATGVLPEVRRAA